MTRHAQHSAGWRSADGSGRGCLRSVAASAGFWLALLPVVLPQAAAARADLPHAEASRQPSGTAAAAAFLRESASQETRQVAKCIAASGDNQGLPFMIVDKKSAKVFQFDAVGRLLGAAPALLGLGRGDDTIPGIGQRRLATISPEERTTPAGRFQASLGHDLEQDVLWIDYDASLSLHRVIAGNPKERRYQRLASESSLDNGISYGCINVPAAFYDRVVMPAFKGTVGIVYILPETNSLEEVFAIPEARPVHQDEVERRPYYLEDSRRKLAR